MTWFYLYFQRVVKNEKKGGENLIRQEKCAAH
jgi:hypothetical protein